MNTPDLCPECGSKNVRWRNRTKRDIVQQWLSYAFDSTIGKIIAGSTTQRPYDQSTPSAVSRFDMARLPGAYAANELLYDSARERREFHLGLTTPRRFWRCLSCKNKGRVYDFELIEHANRDTGR